MWVAVAEFISQNYSHRNISHPFLNLAIPLLEDGIYFSSLGRNIWPPLGKNVSKVMLPDFQGEYRKDNMASALLIRSWDTHPWYSATMLAICTGDTQVFPSLSELFLSSNITASIDFHIYEWTNFWMIPPPGFEQPQQMPSGTRTSCPVKPCPKWISVNEINVVVVLSQ